MFDEGFAVFDDLRESFRLRSSFRSFREDIDRACTLAWCIVHFLWYVPPVMVEGRRGEEREDES